MGPPNNIRAPLIFEIQIWPQKWIQHTRNMSQTYSLYRRFPRLSTRKLKFSIFGGFWAPPNFFKFKFDPRNDFSTLENPYIHVFLASLRLLYAI